MSKLPLHPFLLASVFVLHLMAENLSDQVGAGEVLQVIGSVLLAVTVTFAVLVAVLRKTPLAAVMTSTLVFWIFSFGALREPLSETFGRDQTLIAWTIVGIGGLAIIVALRRWAGGLTGYLNVASALLVLFNLASIVPYQIASAAMPPYRPPGLESLDGVPAETAARRPDIYYIILDRYPSQQTLAGTAYDYDNSAFLEELERRGFYVAPHSHANYTHTALSLASSLNMDYLDLDAMGEVAPRSDAWKPVYDMLAGSLAAPKLLEQQGYSYVQLPSWFEAAAAGAEVDVRYRHGALSEFGDTLYRSTVLPTILEQVGIRGPDSLHVAHALFQFDRLGDLDAVASPKFVFAHILLPHPPVVFGPDGVLPISEWVDGRDIPREAFLGQLEYTNRRVLALVDELLSQADESKPVVIIQADEGPYPPQPVADWRSATPEEYQRKFGILNASYLPGAGETGLYPNITPVNTFRLLFNAYFGDDLPMLEDRVYAIGRGGSIYEGVDITNRLTRDEHAAAVDRDSLVYEVEPPREWTAGATRRYEVRVRNTGSTSWEADGPDAVALRVRFEGVDDSDGFSQEQEFPLPRSVRPGGTATFRVDVTAPDVDGEYLLRHRLAYGFQWFAPGPSDRITVMSTAETWEHLLSASYEVHSPARWTPGELKEYSVHLTNTGDHTWRASGEHRVRLGVHFGSISDVPHDAWATDERFELPHDVPPGESITVDFAVEAPNSAGSYVLRHRLVKEDTAWFDDLSRQTVVVAARWDASWLLAAIAALVLASGAAGALAHRIFGSRPTGRSSLAYRGAATGSDGMRTESELEAQTDSSHRRAR